MATKKKTKKAPAKKAPAKKVKAKAKKAPAKKATAKKAAPKKAAPKKVKVAAAPAPKMKKEFSVRASGFEKVKKTRTKGQIVAELSESTGLSRKEIGNLFDNLSALMKHDLTKGPSTFQIPGLLKVLVVNKPSVPARRGVNPFTGEEMMFKAKPARNIVRARPLKALKDMVK